MITVGEPGRAAGQVRPMPDPMCWDRRDTVLDDITVDAMELRAASVRGLAHRHYGRVRQDEYAFRRTADGRYLLLAVADGVSAGAFSHHAATVAAMGGCHRLARFLATTTPGELPWTELFAELAGLVANEGRKLLRRRGIVDSDDVSEREVARYLATTVLLAVVDTRDEDGHLVHHAGIGDTSCWVLRSGQTWEPQQPVKNANAVIASAGVAALPMKVAGPVEPARTVIRRGEALVLMSDGVGDPLGDGSGDVGAFLADAWHRPPAALEFAAQVGFARRSYDDDRTAIGLWP